MVTKSGDDYQKYFSDKFDFNNRGQVTMAVRLLSDKLGQAFVLNMQKYNPEAFYYHLNTSAQVRSIVYNALPSFAPDGIFATLNVVRKVVNNASIPERSSKVFGVCGYTANQMFDFIKEQCLNLYRWDFPLRPLDFCLVFLCYSPSRLLDI